MCGNARVEVTARHRLSAQQYLALERKAVVKSEFVNGEIFAMAGGTRRHSRIKVKITSALEQRLSSSSCQVFDSDMRLKVEATDFYTYPDAQVACGKLRFEDECEDVLLNPKVIIEVLSDSSAAWDRGEKFWHYRHLLSLAEYVLVSQSAWLVEHYTRQKDGTWVLETVEGSAGVLHLRSIRCKIPLKEIYQSTGLAAVKSPSRKSATHS